MSRRCADPSCYAHDGELCALGEKDLTECPQWSKGTPSDDESPSPATVDSASRVPWSSSALGVDDLANLVPRARSIIVGVLGAHDAGKTTLLTGTYLMCLRGHRLGGAGFAGSRTLGAWESLAAWSRFDDAARPPSFPPHTPRGTGRVPGLLHIALRDEVGSLRDILLADAPGEWFTRWAVNEDAADAAGARWTVRHADVFLILADCKRLVGPKRGQARSDTRQLIERLGNHVGERPVVFVWAKSDIKPKPGIRESLCRSLREHIPHAVEVATTTDDPATLPAAIEAALRPAWRPSLAKPIVEPRLDLSPFASYRGNHERT